MGLRDFFKTVREKKFAPRTSSTETNGLKDEEIAANWVLCKDCNNTIHKSEYLRNLSVCPSCGYHGRISLSERIALLTDRDSFKEIDTELTAADPLEFNDGKPYPETLRKAKAKTGFNEALCTGTAHIDGTKVALAVMNFDFLGGSMGSVVGEKFARVCELAIKERIPFICISSSGGARMHEGILSLMQMAKTSIALDKLSKAKLPYFSLVTDPTYGGVSASFATLGDLIIAEPKARIGFAGRRVIEETVREKLPANFQSAEYLLEHGQIDLIIKRHNLKSSISQLLRLHGFLPKDFKAEEYSPNLVDKRAIDMPKKDISLDFEKPLLKIKSEIETIEGQITNNEDQKLLNLLKEQYSKVEDNIYKNISAIDITKIARHPNRPGAEDFLSIICGRSKWIELHGDRAGTDDQAILTALAEINGKTFVAVATRKGRTIKDNQLRNFGMPQPEGYRKAKRFFEYANKFNLPIITFIDTPGAYPGVSAEANGQSIAIAENLKALAGLEVPVISIVTGEGGSGGALAIGVANRVIMLENSVYSVISPEGCAAILWRTRDKAPEAADALKLTAKDLYKLGIIDEIVPEPLGGAHKDWFQVAEALEPVIVKHLTELSKLSGSKLYEDRAAKFYAFGAYQKATVKKN